MPKSTTWPGHTAALLFFAACAILFTWPLAGQMRDAVIGAAAGDNFAFVWNFWWARAAFGPDRTFFWTDDLFAPLGTSLVLHTTTPAIAVPMAAVSDADPVALYNAALLLAVFLNGATAYAAAHALTRDRLASILAGLVFAGSPFLLVRLEGHLSVLSAWGLPLLFLAARQLALTGSIGAALATGVCLALLAYVDYYYAIFGGVLTGLWLLASRWSLDVKPRALTSTRRGVVAAAALLMMIGLAVIAWITVTGGTETAIAGRDVSIRSTFNPRAAVWLLGAVLLLAWKWPSLTLVRLPTLGSPWIPLAGATVLTGVLMLPVLMAAFRLWQGGDYVSQPFSWRSAPGGFDLAAIVSGNPGSPLTGGWTQALYRRFGINPIESAVWPGLVPVVVILTTLTRLRSNSMARRIFWIGLFFFVWALGPYLMAFGYNTALILPQAFFKFVPILSNARIPGRAFVVVQLMLALGAALGLASLRQSQGPRQGAALALASILIALVDYWPGRHGVVAVERPALYTTLRAQPPGAVLELPMGIRDGFGAKGDLDHRIFFYQTIHEHPLVGGNLSRISPRIIEAYEQDPVIGPLLLASEPPSFPPKGTGAPRFCQGSLACSIGYLVVDEARASEALERAIDRMFASRLLERNGSRALHAVEALRTCDCLNEPGKSPPLR
jgi:hypothetical protein